VKKYHPDQYQNNPLADLAQEKLTDINAAYDYLKKTHGTGSSSSGKAYGPGSSRAYGGSGYSGNYSYGNSGTSYRSSEAAAQYNRVRASINANRLNEADSILDDMSSRDAEFYFLKGMIFQRRGWYDNALKMFQTAVSMEPNNAEYVNALNSMTAQSAAYRGSSYNRGYGGMSQDDCCRLIQCYICADCCCDCF
jgi:molecular chaperone DnaJ